MINTFKPYLKIYTGRGRLNDWLQLQIYWCNHIGITVRIMGYGIDIGAVLYKNTDSY